MGKGDKKTRRGKLFNGSFGKRRPRKKKKGNKQKTPISKSKTAQPNTVKKIKAPEEQELKVQETIEEVEKTESIKKEKKQEEKKEIKKPENKKEEKEKKEPEIVKDETKDAETKKEKK